MSKCEKDEEMVIDAEQDIKGDFLQESQEAALPELDNLKDLRNIKKDTTENEGNESLDLSYVNENNVSDDIKRDTIEIEVEQCQESSQGTQDDLSGGSPEGKDTEPNDNIEFDAYSDGVNVHRKYKLRTKTQPVSNVEPEHHPRRAHDGPSYLCSKCRKSFDSKTGLLNHMRMHDAIRVYTCSLCQATFDTNDELITHKTVHQGEDRVFLCKTCEMAFTDHCDFLIHEISHTKHSTYKCGECGAYQTPKYIKTHIELHFKRGSACDECGRYFSTRVGLGRHVAKCHAAADAHSTKNKIECVECGKTFPDKASYEPHMAIHTGVKKFQCLYCGKGFARTQARSVHMRGHTDERPFRCDRCPRAFRQHTDLKRHRAAHAGKTHHCNMCDKKYLHPESLRLHLMVHTQQNLLHCPICDRGCPTRQGLKKHLLFKHSTEKGFRCDLCDVSFKDGGCIRKHNNSKAHKRAQFAALNKAEVEI